ncbi:TetR/AcrR family transcriptional regulator [Desulforamulus aeronauticus]|uniref:Transcriptional regulator, TetR family n=1 Tax=Desulforamulus aeronauticus DSM 10349 TaxID=1121421 RepID=A0A1M6P1H1_9FIRM|nr:TetR/AcrR family transcriptional regulator [Desulforamulus aeronauticus]SHK01754.1 transcriptional regulator, TetR family [Desulforamulus aeronauticus DSM 10349]
MQTRDKIILGFRKLAEEKGFYSATVDELAARHNMSKRTIYRYFKSKEEIIEAVMDSFMKEAEREVFATLNRIENPIEKLTLFIQIVAQKLRTLTPVLIGDLPKHYPQIWEKVEQFRTEKLNYLTGIMIEGSKQGYLKEINHTVVTASLLATVRAVVNPTFIMENNLTPEETFKTVMNTFLYGIVAKDQST